MVIHNPILTGSFTVNNIDVSSITSSAANITALNATTASLNSFSASVLSYTASQNILNGTYTLTSSFVAQTASFTAFTSSINAFSASILAQTASLNSFSASVLSYTSSLNNKTSSFATTGSNTFVGGQYLSSSFNPTGFSTTASLYTDGGLRVTKDAYISGTLYLNNVTVFGTQSVAYITSSQLNISTNLISVNTDTPSVRFGGLSVYDSGSTGLTGSILWDSENNKWIYSNPSGSSYSGGMFISGPRASSLGSETGTTACMLLAGQGGDHLTSSMIYHSSTVTCFHGNTKIDSTGSACFASTVCAPAFIGGTLTTYSPGGGVNSSTFYDRVGSVGAEVDQYGTLNTYSGIVNSNGIYSSGASGTALVFRAGAVEQFSISATNMNVVGSITNRSALYVRASGNSDLPFINFSNADGVYNWGRVGGLLQGDGDGALYFQTKLGGGLTEKLRITSAGIACFANTICAPQLRLSGTTSMILQPSFIGSSNLRNGGAIQYSKNFTIFTDDGATGCGFDLQYWNGSSYYPGLRLNNVSSGFANLVLMQDGGSVGIGTSSPSQKLEVYSSSGDAGLKIKSANCTGTTRLILNPEGAGAGSTGDGVIFFDMNSTAWVAGVDKSDSSKFKIANDVYGDFRANNYLTLTTSGNVGINTTVPSQKLHLIGGFLQTADNSSWYRNVFERNVSTWDNVVGFSPQSSPQYTYGYINITASGYVNGTSAGGVTTSRWYYSITNNSISVSVVGSDISTGSQAPSIRLVVSSGTIYVQVQSGTPAATSYTTIFVDAMLASGYVNGTYWLIS